MQLNTYEDICAFIYKFLDMCGSDSNCPDFLILTDKEYEILMNSTPKSYHKALLVFQTATKQIEIIRKSDYDEIYQR